MVNVSEICGKSFDSLATFPVARALAVPALSTFKEIKDRHFLEFGLHRSITLHIIAEQTTEDFTNRPAPAVHRYPTNLQKVFESTFQKVLEIAYETHIHNVQNNIRILWDINSSNRFHRSFGNAIVL